MIMTYQANKTSFFSIRWWKNLWEKISSFKFFPSNSPSKRTRSEGDVDLIPVTSWSSLPVSVWSKSAIVSVEGNESFDTVSIYSDRADSVEDSKRPYSMDNFDDSQEAMRLRFISTEGDGRVTQETLEKKKQYQPETYKRGWFSMFGKVDATKAEKLANNRIEVQRTCDGTYIL